MYATVSTVDVDDSTDIEERVRRVNDDVLPGVRSQAGFVAGYWLAPTSGQGMSVVVWDSEDAARTFAGTRQPGTEVQPGVTVRSSEVRRVIASA
jgi:hypothetical protein